MAHFPVPAAMVVTNHRRWWRTVVMALSVRAARTMLHGLGRDSEAAAQKGEAEGQDGFTNHVYLL